MSGEVIKTGRTIDIAVEEACKELNASRDDVEVEVLEIPKKTMFGLKVVPAKVKVTYNEKKSGIAVRFISDVIRVMGISQPEMKIEEDDHSATITLEGEGLGILIGRRGETLDAVQYLAGLVTNRKTEEYFRITINSGNFREKREQTLQQLALKLANIAVKTGKRSILEPMNPYERRIIHATVQTVPGATSSSIGDEPNRRVVITSKNAKKPFDKTKTANGPAKRFNNDGRPPASNRDGYKKPRGGYSDRPYRNPRWDDVKTTPQRPVEQTQAPAAPAALPNNNEPLPGDSKKAPLYTKIDFGE